MFHRTATLVVGGVLLVGVFAPMALGQNRVVGRFDVADEVSPWFRQWGGVPTTFSHDTTMDAGGSASQGSLKVEAEFSESNSDNQIAIARWLGYGDMTTYATMEYDIYMDPASPTRGDWTDHGYAEWGLDFGSSWAFRGGPAGGLLGGTNDGHWVHVSIPLGGPNGFPADALPDVQAITFHIWGGDAGRKLNGKMTFWLDNIYFTPKAPPPQGFYIVNDFNSAEAIGRWRNDVGTAGTPITVEWDPTVDANNDAASGSMKITAQFDATAYGDNNQVLLTTDLFGSVGGNLSEYTHFIARVKVDPTSPQDPGGHHGSGGFIIRNSGWSWTPVSTGNYASSGAGVNANGWFEFDVAMKADTPQRDQIIALTMQIWGGGWQALTGTTVVWVDYIRFGRIEACTNPEMCELCDNLTDDNGDGKTDCEDPDCYGSSLCPSEAVCSDGIDDDGDGRTDCADPDCAADANCAHNDPFADVDGDKDVDQVDFAKFQLCYSGNGTAPEFGCGFFDRDNDGDVDGLDFGYFQNCWSGPAIPVDVTCDDGLPQ